MNKTGKGYFQTKFSESEINHLIRLYEKGENFTQIAKKMGCAKNTITNCLKKHGIQLPVYIRYSADYDFFQQIDTESKAYWLGFIAADGCLTDHNDYRLTISLKRADAIHLVHFKNAISATHRIYEHKHIAKGIYSPMSSIAISSKKLFFSLVSQGISPRKSFNLSFPTQIPQDLIRHFVRGYFDGDGGWYLQKKKYPAFSIIGSRIFIQHLQLILISACNLPNNKLLLTNHPDIIRVSYTGGKQCKRLFHYLYKDASIWMPRKKDKVAHYF
jgi:intein-encoded DNA endonuclease-like protein